MTASQSRFVRFTLRGMKMDADPKELTAVLGITPTFASRSDGRAVWGWQSDRVINSDLPSAHARELFDLLRDKQPQFESARSDGWSFDLAFGVSVPPRAGFQLGPNDAEILSMLGMPLELSADWEPR